jgi:hypothetical protein
MTMIWTLRVSSIRSNSFVVLIIYGILLCIYTTVIFLIDMCAGLYLSFSLALSDPTMLSFGPSRPFCFLLCLSYRVDFVGLVFLGKECAACAGICTYFVAAMITLILVGIVAFILPVLMCQ